VIHRLREMVSSWLLPKPVSIYRGVEVNRCRSDGLIVTKNSKLEYHAGHYVISPVTLTLWEKALG